MQGNVEEAIDIARGGRILAVTGAGMSTDSSLPDYRGTGSTPTTPVDVDMFTSDPVWYRWLWYRNEATWKILENCQPNDGHRALATMEASGHLLGVSTQNVDRLDARAGTRNVWELHGRYDTVECLSCGSVTSRAALSVRLRALNPDLVEETDPAHVDITPDARRDLAEVCTFTPAYCERCGGMLKPSIVMFGEGLPESAFGPSLDMAASCNVVLVAGTSLAVSTGLWVVHEAMRAGASLIVVNRGATVVDRFADVRIAGGTSEVLSQIATALTS